MTAKQQVEKVLEKLPDDCSLEDVQYHLYVVEKLRRRVEMAERGEYVSLSEAERRLEKWLQ